MFQELPDVLEIRDLQEVLHIGKDWAYRLIREGSIKSLKIGKTYKIPKVFLIEYLLNSKQ